MLDLAVGHATERHQFGRPIGSFQAVKHRLADVFVLTTAARAALHESWRADDPMVSAIARSLAARAHAEACRQCQQVMGGMGFTSEVPLHRYLRRGGLLDTLLGTGRALRTEIGSRILTERTVPRIPKFA
jgi:alkylation response protein AidB-like acyl-CoA dehydrogenase